VAGMGRHRILVGVCLRDHRSFDRRPSMSASLQSGFSSAARSSSTFRAASVHPTGSGWLGRLGGGPISYRPWGAHESATHLRQDLPSRRSHPTDPIPAPVVIPELPGPGSGRSPCPADIKDFGPRISGLKLEGDIGRHHLVVCVYTFGQFRLSRIRTPSRFTRWHRLQERGGQARGFSFRRYSPMSASRGRGGQMGKGRPETRPSNIPRAIVATRAVPPAVFFRA